MNRSRAKSSFGLIVNGLLMTCLLFLELFDVFVEPVQSCFPQLPPLGQPVLSDFEPHCRYQGPWVASFDSLARVYSPRGVRVVVLADDAPGATLDSALQRAAWREAVSVIGVASGALPSWFDRSRDAPERATERVKFILPSFLLIDANGQVVR